MSEKMMLLHSGAKHELDRMLAGRAKTRVSSWHNDKFEWDIYIALHGSGFAFCLRGTEIDGCKTYILCMVTPDHKSWTADTVFNSTGFRNPDLTKKYGLEMKCDDWSDVAAALQAELASHFE